MSAEASHGAPAPKLETASNARTLMVLGKNIGADGWNGQRIRESRFHLSPHMRADVLAAGIALKHGLADEVVFTVINTAGQEPLTHNEAVSSGDRAGELFPVPSEAELAARQFRRIFPSLKDKVKIQPFSWDTNTDAKEAKKLVDDKKIAKDFILMTPGFHERRAKFLFGRKKLKPQILTTEEVLAIRRPHFADSYKNSELYKKDKKREDRIYWIQRIPFVANMITRITKRTRDIKVYTKENAGKPAQSLKPATAGSH